MKTCHQYEVCIGSTPSHNSFANSFWTHCNHATTYTKSRSRYAWLLWRHANAGSKKHPPLYATIQHTGSVRSVGGRQLAVKPALARPVFHKQRVIVPRATAVVGSETAAVQESEKYGIFKLDYDVKNVRSLWVWAKDECVGGSDHQLISTRLGKQEDPNLTKTWKKTLQIAVSGAAGQISNHLLFMVRDDLAVYVWLIVAGVHCCDPPPHSLHLERCLAQNSPSH